MATLEAYEKHDWMTGRTISEANLDNIRQGLEAVTNAVIALQKATAKATQLESGQQPTVSFDGSAFTFGIPKGTNGKPGSNGVNGKSFRTCNVALTANQTGVALSSLVPTHADLPVSVGDIVECISDKKLYKITKVTDTTSFDIGAELVATG